MGNGPSRRQRTEPAVYPPQRIYSLPPGPVSYTSVPPYHPTNGPPPYHSNYNGSGPPPAPHFYPAGHYSGGPQNYPLQSSTNSSYWPPSSVPLVSVQSSAVPPPQQESVGQQNTVTVRNAVNIQKSTIRLVEDAENPGFSLLAFTYDADSAGSFDIFFLAKEDEKDGSIKPLNAKFFSPVRLPFEKGCGKKFQQASGTGIYLDAFDSSDLEKEGPDEVSPLVIRAQINGGDVLHDSREEDIGAALPKSVNSQVTQAVLEKRTNGVCKVRVLRQIIWVDGVRYELKELYGIENTVDRSEYDDDDDFGKECVICMSEPRDTAVMPCRHMCMCNGCASSFKSQMNRCPICRQPVESFLKIKVKG